MPILTATNVRQWMPRMRMALMNIDAYEIATGEEPRPAKPSEGVDAAEASAQLKKLDDWRLRARVGRHRRRVLPHRQHDRRRPNQGPS